MQTISFNFSLLSETFAHGAYQTQDFNQPELRAPSVKGMIRWWHKALAYAENDAKQIFGAINPTQASAISIRIQPLQISEANTAFMPHKSNGGYKNAIKPGSSYQLTLTPRRGGLSPQLEDQLLRATKCWLLLGSIGQRSNRAAGSIHWDQAPTDQKQFEITASELLQGSKVSFAILDHDLGNDSNYAREISGDFLSEQAFGGMAPFGGINPRKSSPLKLKCIRIEDTLRLLAIWDHRIESANNLETGIQKLVQADKLIGHLLEQAFTQLTS